MWDHKKLRAFELADQLAMITYKQTAKLPKDELFGLVSQMRRLQESGFRKTLCETITNCVRSNWQIN